MEGNQENWAAMDPG